MILPRATDSIHKAWLYRLLTAIIDNSTAASSLAFKGGTYASMRGWLDRFSVDLDFDFIGPKDKIPVIEKELEKIFKDLGLTIKDKSQNTIQYFLKYQVKDTTRNTIKIDTLTTPPKNNKYEQVSLADINRTLTCHTQSTMVSNKLVALVERFERNETIAGRDLYDIHHFLLNGYEYQVDIIKERQAMDAIDFFEKLIQFIEINITDKIINQDLNFLLPNKEFQKIRKTLKQETLILLKDEIKRLKS